MERIDFTAFKAPEYPPVQGLVVLERRLGDMDDVWSMNRTIFGEERIINSFEKEHLLILEARLDGMPVGFKVGYRENSKTFYSAKGGVLPDFRRKGIAIHLLNDMMQRVSKLGYQIFAFDTFPNLHPGMTILAMENGFRLVKADYNAVYKEYRLRFEKKLD